MEHHILLAGFGGQGILFAGKVLAQMGLMMGNNVSWLPSYGPEMRGGTANCNVIISNGEIGSPIVNNPTILFCMNQPSLEKFAREVKKNGIIVFDSSLVSVQRDFPGVNMASVPATEMAQENGMKALANMVLLGKMVRETDVASFDELVAGVKGAIPARKQELLEKNLAAIEEGYNY